MTRTTIAAALVVLTVLAGCIPPRPSPTPPPAASAAPTASPDRTASGTFPTAPASPAVAVDPSLLDLLPDTVGGVPLESDEATAAEVAGEQSIAPFISALAVAAAFGPPSTDTPDYVVVTVARLKPGLFGDLFYRGWRDTFDAAVCEQAGGVAGHAEAEIGGRQTFIGTCAGRVHTYHVALPDQDVIVSLQGTGDRRFGERVVEGLTG
ncbi:MAG TPA: hypothetical protein VK867_07970 [Candidatus Limnocylindrales bacterium]|nr:hypothetical protein [Candidatus Limnocylindrales bacterium]